MFKQYIYIFAVLFSLTSCQSQTEEQKTTAPIGGPCEGCEAIYEYGDRQLNSVDTLPGFLTTTPKLKITGTVYQQDGETPAENVILYIYHTDRTGVYPTKGNEQGWAKRHGYIRGWVKTKADGRYTFYTFRPAAYPSGQAPEHIHITVKEPHKKEYYLDDYFFKDDPKLTSAIRNERKNRGGSGLVQPIPQNGVHLINRDIILGRNIPNYQ